MMSGEACLLEMQEWASVFELEEKPLYEHSVDLLVKMSSFVAERCGTISSDAVAQDPDTKLHLLVTELQGMTFRLLSGTLPGLIDLTVPKVQTIIDLIRDGTITDFHLHGAWLTIWPPDSY